MKPHKHAELIKAWADGAEIEQRFNAEGYSWAEFDDTWADTDHYEYRIKPEEKKPVVRWKWACRANNYWIETNYFYSESEAKEQFKKEHYKKLDYTRTEFEE